MKYHGYIIKKVSEDLGEDDPRLNCVYQILDKKNKYVGTALTLSTAKEYIDSGLNPNYL